MNAPTVCRSCGKEFIGRDGEHTCRECEPCCDEPMIVSRVRSDDNVRFVTVRCRNCGWKAEYEQ